MNESEIKQLIEKNKELLIERIEIQHEKYEKNIEIKEIEKQIVEISNIKENYKNLKNEKIKAFLVNMTEYAIVFLIIYLGLNVDFLNINDSFMSKLNHFFSFLFGISGVALILSYNDDLKCYKQQVGKECFKKDFLIHLEEIHKIKEQELKKIKNKLNKNTNKLDKIYEMSINENKIQTYNNEYTNENEKSMQKSLKKR